MTDAVNVLLVETDELELHERVEQVLMDGYAVDAVAAADQAKIRLADGPDALILCGEAQTIGLLRELRAGRSRGLTPALRCWWSAPMMTRRRCATTAPARTSRCRQRARRCSWAAGLEALVRRTGPPQRRIMRVGGLTVDRDARTAHADGRSVKLTRLEFDLLATLVSEPRRTFTGAELTREVWTYDPQAAGPSRTVHSHVHRLRHKLEQAGAQEMVQTVSGVGWRLTR
jgi:DNA-binding response OmpR family regulator